MSEDRRNRDHVYAGAAAALLGVFILLVFNEWSFRSNGPLAGHLRKIFAFDFSSEIFPWLSIFLIALAAASLRRAAKVLTIVMIPGFILAFLGFGAVLILGGVPMPNTTGGWPIDRSIPLFATATAIAGVYYSMTTLRPENRRPENRPAENRRHGVSAEEERAPDAS
ncbi:MAG: hypothetical protein AAFY22_01905 [Pseudomonadota bacterium]